MAKGCDTAAYLTDSRVDALVGKGYSFVGRYIDYLKGAHNDLTEKEVGLICNAGLEIVSLYQPKGMNSSTHYSASQGKSDVIEALELARYLRQPKNTAIYFCVDFDPLESVVRSNILPYFDAVYQAIIDKEGNPEGYRMGVYGSGLVCSSVEKNKSSVYTMQLLGRDLVLILNGTLSRSYLFLSVGLMWILASPRLRERVVGDVKKKLEM